MAAIFLFWSCCQMNLCQASEAPVKAGHQSRFASHSELCAAAGPGAFPSAASPQATAHPGFSQVTAHIDTPPPQATRGGGPCRQAAPFPPFLARRSRGSSAKGWRAVGPPHPPPSLDQPSSSLSPLKARPLSQEPQAGPAPPAVPGRAPISPLHSRRAGGEGERT